MQTMPKMICAVLLAVLLGGCSTTPKDQKLSDETDFAKPESVEEIAPGMLRGYIDIEQQLDSTLFVLPSPPGDSSLQALDTAWADRMQTLRGTSRYELATLDADLGFPVPASVFSCALGIKISEENTPSLYMLLWRTMTDIGLSPYAAKNLYGRERPFMVREEPVCTPGDEEALRGDPSYPSGHTAIGWGWALILTELAPENAEALLARGRAFGESRNVCNAHWYSDVVAGRMTGAAAVARLHSEPEFLSAMGAAKEDITQARKSGLVPTVDCEAEAAALGTPLY